MAATLDEVRPNQRRPSGVLPKRVPWLRPLPAAGLNAQVPLPCANPSAPPSDAQEIGRPQPDGREDLSPTTQLPPVFPVGETRPMALPRPPRSRHGALGRSGP